MEHIMITAKELNTLGLPADPRLMSLALKLVNSALARGSGEETDHPAKLEAMRAAIRALAAEPESMLNHEPLGPLARMFTELFPDGAGFTPREPPAPWKQWGSVDVEEEAVRQMENACRIPGAVRGALMPDAHTGYGLPIGGVLAVKNAVIPYAVGVDIACRMRLTVLDMPLARLFTHRDEFITAIERETRFGMGSGFEKNARRVHPVMDEDWNVSPITRVNRDKAWKQLGSSGGGNHFVEFGELQMKVPARMGETELMPGSYLALLSHSGSRGTGESVALHYSERAMSLRPRLPDSLRRLAWLDSDSEEGREYWAAMQLMGRYAAANHELIHAHVLKALGAQELTHVENHHNFAWKEEHGGESVIVHRKGATPADTGRLGIVPGSMCSPAFVVRGKGCEEALCSCSHGAGRLMSRAAAFRQFKRADMDALLRENGVELLSAGLDEAPMVYKDIHAVMTAQHDLVDILATFQPRLVKMARDEPRHKRR